MHSKKCYLVDHNRGKQKKRGKSFKSKQTKLTHTHIYTHASLHLFKQKNVTDAVTDCKIGKNRHTHTRSVQNYQLSQWLHNHTLTHTSFRFVLFFKLFFLFAQVDYPLLQRSAGKLVTLTNTTILFLCKIVQTDLTHKLPSLQKKYISARSVARDSWDLIGSVV